MVITRLKINFKQFILKITQLKIITVRFVMSKVFKGWT